MSEQSKEEKAYQEFVVKMTKDMNKQDAEAFKNELGQLMTMDMLFDESPKGSLKHEVGRVLDKVWCHCKKEKNVEMLYTMAVCATQHLNFYKFTHLAWLKAVAQKRNSWPVLKYATTASTKQIEAFIKKIDLGERYGLPLRLKSGYRSKPIFVAWAKTAHFSISASRCPGNIWAPVPFLYSDTFYGREYAGKDIKSEVKPGHGRCYTGAEFNRRCIALPDLRKDTAHEWAEVVKYYVQLVTDGHPENDPYLVEANKGGRAKRDDAPPGKGTSKANIRDAIVTKISNTFITLVR